MKPLIAVDIGNTSIHLARFDQGKWRSSRRIVTSHYREELFDALKPLVPSDKNACVVIAGVVPEAGKYLERAIPKKLRVETRLIGPAFPVPMKNLYKIPSQVGVDRLLNGLAAYDKVRGPVIVIDFGTAITFDVVTQRGEYRGGVIAPGIEISLEALFQKTALLPKIRLQHPKKVVGRDTVESIRVGCSVGIGGLCDRIIDEIEKSSRLRAKVIATGGYAGFMSKYCRRISAIDPDLLFKGIQITYRHHVGRFDRQQPVPSPWP